MKGKIASQPSQAFLDAQKAILRGLPPRNIPYPPTQMGSRGDAFDWIRQRLEFCEWICSLLSMRDWGSLNEEREQQAFWHLGDLVGEARETVRTLEAECRGELANVRDAAPNGGRKAEV